MNHPLNDSMERNRFLKFATVGAMGTALDFAAFNILSASLHLQPVIASVLSFSAAVVNNFLWNRHWTYPESRGKAVHHQMAQFGLVNLGGLIIRTPIFALLENPLGELATRYGAGAEAANRIGHNMALGVAILIVMLWNYFANRHWTYNDV